MNTKTLRASLTMAGMFAGVAAASLVRIDPPKPDAPAATPVAPATTTPASTDVKDKDKSKDKDKKHETAQIGEPAPDFTLTDVDGKTFKLSDATKAGKIVVLTWFNPGCPVVQFHYKTRSTFIDLSKAYADKNVVVVAINSGGEKEQGSGKALNLKTKLEWKIPFQLALDESGKVGHMYGAKTTPHCFVIDKDGKLAYEGAIDNNTQLDEKPDPKTYVNYVSKALDELLKGSNVSEPQTRPYGCAVKYGSKK